MKASARWHREWCATLAARLVTSLIVLGAGRTPADAQLGNVPWAMLSHDLHHTGKSAVVGPLTANLKWTQFLHIGFVKSSPMVGKDQMGNPTIYIGAAYNVLALDAATGATKWIHKLPANVRRNSAAIGQDGTIYIGARDNRLWALNPDGTPKWSYTVGNDGDVNTSPAVAPDGTIYMAGTFGGVVHAINPDGSLKWKLPSGSGISYISPVVGDDGTIYIGLGLGRLRAINPDGTLKWDVNVGGLIRYASPAIAADGTIFIGSRLGLTAVRDDTTQGTILWSFPTAGGVEASPAIASDGTIYVGSVGYHAGAQATLYALTPSGTQLWGYEGNDAFRGGPAIGANGVIYTTAGNRITAVNPDGTLLWEYTTGRGLPIISSPALGGDGSLYVGGDLLYAFAP